MSTSARKENRWRKQVIDSNNAASDLQRLMEAAHMERSPRKQTVKSAAPATRKQVRAWMASNSHDYSNATELAEAANIAFDLPGEGLDDETHWVWDEAADAAHDSEDY